MVVSIFVVVPVTRTSMYPTSAHAVCIAALTTIMLLAPGNTMCPALQSANVQMLVWHLCIEGLILLYAIALIVVDRVISKGVMLCESLMSPSVIDECSI